MTLKEKIDREFEGLIVLGAFRPTELVSLDVDGGRLECELTALDSIACSFQHLTLKTDKLAGAPIDRLQKLAETLASRLSYLLESLGAVETDAEGCVVQMRSNPPHKDDNGTAYYELMVRRGGELSLRRYAKAPGAQRKNVPAHVTCEVFHRLAADFVAAVS